MCMGGRDPRIELVRTYGYQDRRTCGTIVENYSEAPNGSVFIASWE